MFEYKNSDMSVNIKDELMVELLSFSEKAEHMGIVVPKWLKAAAKEYDRKLIKDELKNMVSEPGYEWFNDTTSDKEADMIFGMVASRYVITENDDTNDNTINKRQKLDSLLADTHYGFITIRDMEGEEKSL